MSVDRKDNDTLDIEHVSQVTRLLEKRRQMFIVQEKLEKQQQEFARREESFRHREEALRKKDLELQESLIKFNKFLQENEAKKNRADKRYDEEKKLRTAKENEIAKLENTLDQGKLENKALSETLSKSIRYQTCLENVADASDEFLEVRQLIDRYKTLENAHNDLKDKAKVTEELHEKERSEYAQYTKDRTNDILNMNNEIAKLQKHLEHSEATNLRMQSDVESSLSRSSNKTLALGQLFMATKNLVLRCTSDGHGSKLKHLEQELSEQAKHEEEREKELLKNGHGKKIDTQDEEMNLTRKGERAASELDVIAKYLIDFADIVKNCPKHLRNA